MSTTHVIPKSAGAPGISAHREPALTIAPGTGERITFETDDTAYAQMHEHGDMAKVTAPLNPVTGPVHTAVTGGMPGWQVALIAVAAALFAATIAVLAGRAWAARRKTTTAAA